MHEIVYKNCPLKIHYIKSYYMYGTAVVLEIELVEYITHLYLIFFIKKIYYKAII